MSYKIKNTASDQWLGADDWGPEAEAVTFETWEEADTVVKAYNSPSIVPDPQSPPPAPEPGTGGTQHPPR
jgi:hypothetical protein